MAGDRDLGVAVATARFAPPSKDRTGWEMTAATGVRGLRLLQETEVFAAFTFSETNPEACRVLRENASRVPGAIVREGNARLVPESAPFDYVDLDPYGSPLPLLRTALGAARPGGVVAVTATDMMVLAGAQSSACWRRYSARPVRGRLGPEGGLRILLAQLVRDAQALDRSVRPILAYARDHYVRAYVEVRGPSTEAPPIDVIEPERWTGPSVGDRGPYGPLWLGPLFDPEVVLRLAVPTAAARSREVEQFIARLREETTVDRPFYYEANVLSSHLHLPSPPRLDTVREGLRALGYQVARTHARPEGFRTDAPRSEVEALFRRLSGG